MTCQAERFQHIKCINLNNSINSILYYLKALLIRINAKIIELKDNECKRIVQVHCILQWRKTEKNNG